MMGIRIGEERQKLCHVGKLSFLSGNTSRVVFILKEVDNAALDKLDILL